MENIAAKIDASLQLNEITKILGFFNKKDCEQTNIINHLIISTNYFIHITKYKETLPTVGNFKSFLSNTEYLERQIALKKQKLDLHREKWNLIFN